MLKNNKQKQGLLFALTMILGILAMPELSFAQGISVGLSGAAAELHQANGVVSTLVMAIGGIIGLVGGIRVYIKWNNGEREIQKEIVGWAGACVFLIMTGVVLNAFGIA